MKNYQCILFDLDGTLTYSHEGIFACIRYALQKMGKDEPTMDALRLCVGPTLLYSFETYFHLTKEEAVEATRLYRERYATTGIWENSPIPYAKTCLQRLKSHGYRLAMATSKPIYFASQISQKFGFAPYFETEVGSGMDDGTLPTKGAVIAEAIRRLGVGRDACLMVGDRKHDVDGARENDVDCALLRIGYAENEEEFVLAKPKYVLDDLKELTDLLTNT